MIFLELSANRETIAKRPVKECYSFFGSDGRPTSALVDDKKSGHELSAQITAFAASLNWLAMRTTFYTYFSYKYDADAILHPIRSAFQMSLAGRLGLKEGAFTPILRRLSDETVQVVKDVTSASDPVISEMQLPLFSAWLVSKAGGPRKAIAAAYQMRNEKPVSQARRRLIDLEQTLKQTSRAGFVRDVNILIKDIRKAGDTLRQLYGVNASNGVSISPLIAIINVIGKMKGMPSLPSVPLKVPLPGKVLELGVRNGFKGVCRSVVKDLVAIGRLGEYHEKLIAEVRFKDQDVRTYLAKTENLQYFGRASHWKRPM